MVKTAGAINAGDDAVLLALASDLGQPERQSLARALAEAQRIYEGRVLGTGEGALEHGLGMALLASELRMDASARTAALLFAVPDFDKAGVRTLEQRFGASAAALVSGISRFNEFRSVTRASARADAAQLEALRKMLLAMASDVRVVLLRLASRTQSLRYLARTGASVETSIDVARETLDLYAPLANRLGVWQLKWELEDLSFRFIEPPVYKRIAGMLDERRAERERFIAGAMETMRLALREAGIVAEVTGRPKHIYSIYSKMRAKSLDFDQVHDVRALRVLVQEVADCYAALGIVHDLWQPIAADFDDYIGRPKPNGYRSLHTAVTGEDGRPLEVQIRTHEMHRVAELGVAAHWRYKEGGRSSAEGKEGGAAAGYEDKVALLRQMLAWRDEVTGLPERVGQRAALEQTIYVLTPQDQVVDLPRGATPVDFAYSVHTGLGHRCRGAKINGAIVPLDRALANGDRVEIIAARAQEAGPSRDWLNPALGYIASSRARNKVRQWFNAVDLERTIAEGRAVVEKELQREGATGLSHAELAAGLGFAGAQELYTAAGRDEVGHRQLQLAIRGEPQKTAVPPAPLAPEAARAGSRPPGGILVVGVDRLMTQLARCCKPVPPDDITGFVTRGRGVSIHRSGCASLARLRERHPERLLEAQWGKNASGAAAVSSYPVDIAVHARERIDLLRDVSEILAREQIRVSGLQSYARDGSAALLMTLEVQSLGHLRRTLPLIESVSGVLSARRR